MSLGGGVGVEKGVVGGKTVSGKLIPDQESLGETKVGNIMDGSFCDARTDGDKCGIMAQLHEEQPMTNDKAIEKHGKEICFNVSVCKGGMSVVKIRKIGCVLPILLYFCENGWMIAFEDEVRS